MVLKWSLFIGWSIVLVMGSCNQYNNNYMMVCYYTDWSSYRLGKGTYVPEDIPGAPCTDVIYSFAILNKDTLDAFQPADPDLAFKSNFYQRVTALSSQGIRVILSAGGWLESTPKYSTMLADEQLRTNLAKQTTNFIIENNFCGFNFDLEYPGAYQGKVESKYADDKENFVEFLRLLKLEFQAVAEQYPDICPLTLSVAVPANEKIVDVGYDVERIAELCDWIGVMTYDFFLHSDGVTGYVAPFESVPGIRGPKEKFNVVDGMNLWLKRGAPAEKLVVGFPCYGQSFLLDDENRHYYGAPANGEPTKGEFTQASGTLAFYEIIDNVYKKKFSVVHNPYLETYAYQGLDWVSYDDTLDAAIKADYVIQNCFRGAMFWSLDNECFQKDCPTGRYPLMWTVYNIFSGQITVEEVVNIT